ncbi:MAG: hypothetical protein SGI97_10890 [candidate division Zixibacteria bacterium]|nr:hypothetical protein [candidate division Zixibacteria bacterium]
MALSRGFTSKIIYLLSKKKKLQRIEKGRYLVIPPVAWKSGKFTEESLIIAAQLIDPYYVTYWTALNFYGWTEQPSRTVFIATTKVKRTVTVEGTGFKFVKLRQDKFFGFTEQWLGDQKVAIASKEKTIIDCLDQPRYAGEIVEVAKGLWYGRTEFNFDLMLNYIDRMGNYAIVKRLGYLLDTLGILDSYVRSDLQKRLTYGYVDLDTHGAPSKHTLNPDWRIRVNVKPSNLTEWIQH